LTIFYISLNSGTKRAFIQDCANYLSLGGFSKPGYPGIVVIEGDKLDVLEWVNRVQRLRWKHMVVRGEQIQQLYPPATESDIAENKEKETDIAIDIKVVTETYAKQLINDQRKLPCAFLGEVADTSQAGSICDKYGIHDLYLTAMKIYNASDDAEQSGT
jgi:hypothetical protein